MRVGIGYDIHRFGARRPLVLGGVRLSDCDGLVGHSDADPVMHAVADAIFGAAALGDIGEHFPDTSPEWENADSAGLLAKAASIVADSRALVPVNLDVNIIAQWPRLGPHKQDMRERLAEVLNLPVDCVSVKARTAEGLGAVGAGEAIEVHAVVLMREKD